MPAKNIFKKCCCLILTGIMLLSAGAVCADPFGGVFEETKKNGNGFGDIKKTSSVELEADKVGFSQVDNKATAEGNVVVTSGKEKLYADKVTIDRSKQEAQALGHVYLDSPSQQVDADGIHYNFSTQTGHFDNARVFNAPFQIKGPVINKVSQTHYTMDKGYLTTCDHDVPHFRLKMKRMDYYQGDKAVAHGVTMYIGKMPVMYMPRYTQDLKNKPWFTFLPGFKKDLGAFLLTRSRVFSNDYLTTTIRMDLYERQGIGWGMDNKYRTDNLGSGIFKHYYINERTIGNKHPWMPKTIVSTNNERYKFEWRHKWDINDKTNAIWQYYRLSDDVLLKKYFERESRRDPSIQTFFLLTRALPAGNVSFRWDQRVNRFTSAVDRMPEIKYENSGSEIGDSGFYVKTTDTYSNLVSRAASPTEDRKKTHRFDTNNELYYPMKIAFIQARPFVGGDHTYYSRTVGQQGNIVRGDFRTGTDLSTRFFKVWNYKKDILGMKIDRLRHVITPTAAYIYQHDPTVVSSKFNQMDGIDSITRSHRVGLGLENKLQTKRGKGTVDLLRVLTSSNFTFANDQKGVKPNFSPIKLDAEFKPTSWLSFKGDEEYDHKQDHINSANFETYINGGDKWTFGIGRRYTRKVDDQITAEWSYRINPKWMFKVYDRFAIDTGILKEEGYVITRDLHEWIMEFLYHQIRGGGSEFLLTFTLKAFPDMNLDLFGTSFHQRKAGSQSSP